MFLQVRASGWSGWRDLNPWPLAVAQPASRSACRAHPTATAGPPARLLQTSSTPAGGRRSGAGPRWRGNTRSLPRRSARCRRSATIGRRTARPDARSAPFRRAAGRTSTKVSGAGPVAVDRIVVVDRNASVPPVKSTSNSYPSTVMVSSGPVPPAASSWTPAYPARPPGAGDSDPVSQAPAVAVWPRRWCGRGDPPPGCTRRSRAG